MDDFNQQPYSNISARRRLVLSKPVIGSAIVVIIAIFVGIWWWLGHNQSAQEQAALQQALNELNRAVATCSEEKNPENCRAGLVEEAALDFGSAELCRELNGDDLTNCAWKIAVEKNDPEACRLISDETKQTSCLNSVYRSLADVEMDLSWCEKITSESLRTRCVSTMTEKIASEQGCQGTGVDQSVCDRLEALEAAVASSNPDNCLTLADNDDQVDCLDRVGSGDRDKDGLNASQESALGTSDASSDTDSDGLSDNEEYRRYGTDPIKDDSDGDGYSDGEEVKNGYNPLGAGVLVD